MKYVSCLILALGPLLLSAQSKNFIDQPYIELTGTAEMEITPDEIYITVKLRESDSKGRVSIEQQEKDVYTRLQGLGIDVGKQVKVTDFESSLELYRIKKNQVQKSKDLEIQVKDATMVARVFQALEKSAVSNAYVSRTDHSEMERFRREIKLEALKVAQEKARRYAEVLGQGLGKALYVEERPTYGRGPTPLAQSNIALVESDYEAPATEFKKIYLNFRMMARFALD